MTQGISAGDRWSDRRFVSWGLRAAAFVAPILAAILCIWVFTRFVDRPTSFLLQLVFWLAVIAVAVAGGLAMDHFSRRLLPLATLFRMPLAFPGKAPNRFTLPFGSGPTSAAALESATELSSDDMAARHLLSLVRVLTRHDPRTRGHSERVRAYGDMIGEQLELSESDLDRVRWGALIHDVGKLSVPPEILGGSDRPTAEEWQTIREHAIASEPYLYAVADWLGSGALAAVQHHERWDGQGYPDGLAGEAISLPARVVSVADAYDAMTSTRSYREPLRPSMAREQIARNAGAQFDPAVVRAFLDVPVWRLRLVLGPLGWLNELIWFTRLPHLATGAAATAGVAAIAGIGAAALFASSTDTAGGPGTGEDETVAPVETTTTTTTSTSTSTTTTTIPTTTTTPTTTSIVLSTTSTSTSTTTTTATVVAEPTTTPSPTTTAPPTTAAPTTAAPTTTAPTTSTTAPVIAPEPTGAGFVLTAPADLPTDLAEGRLSSDANAFVVSEGVATAAADVDLRSYVDGTPFAGDNPTTQTLAAGTQVCTYLVHADPVDDSAVIVVDLDFGVAPIGFALTTDDLIETDEYDLDGIDYQPEGLNPIDLGLVDGTLTRLRFVSAAGERDQVRIFIPC